MHNTLVDKYHSVIGINIILLTSDAHANRRAFLHDVSFLPKFRHLRVASLSWLTAKCKYTENATLRKYAHYLCSYFEQLLAENGICCAKSVNATWTEERQKFPD